MKTQVTPLRILRIAALTSLSFIVTIQIFAQAPDWEWAKSAGGISYDRGEAITYTSDGNLLVTGYFQVSAVFDTITLTSSLGSDVFIAEYSTSGELLWAKSAAGSSSSSPVPGAIYEDGSGNIYLTGIFGYYSETGGGGDLTFNESTTFTSWGNQDIFIAKYNSTGDFVWAKHIGSDQSDKVVSTMDAAGNIIFSGKLWSTIYFNSTTDTLYPYHMFDIFLAKYDTAGSLISYQHAVSCTAVTEPQDVTTDEGGNIYLAGKYNGKPTFGLPVDSVDLEEDLFYDQGFIARYEPSHGSFKWAFTAGNTASHDYPLTLNSKGGGKIVMSGLYLSSASFGILPDTITLTAPPAAGYGEMYLVQYDTAGNADWAINAGYASAGSLNFYDAYYHAGNLYIAGNYSAGPVVFGQGPDAVSVLLLHSLFVTDYDDSGNLDWVNTAGGFYYEGAEGVTTDSLNNIYITGFYLGGCSFPGTAITLSSAGYEDILVARLDDISVSVPESDLKQNLIIYPVPAREEVTINFGNETHCTLQLFSSQGERLYTANAELEEIKLDLRPYPAGIYFIIVMDEAGKSATQKILKI
jgi:hypothetical protein